MKYSDTKGKDSTAQFVGFGWGDKGFYVKLVGEFVKQGKEIASVGNSGHTSEPHLHIQLQDDISYGEGIPLYFYNYIANEKLVPKGIPTGGIDKQGNFVGQTIYSVK